MFKKIVILFAVLAALVGGTLLAPNFEIQIGNVPAASSLDVKARDLTLACPGSLFKAGGAKGTTLGNFEHVGNVSYVSQFNSTNGASVASNDGVYTVTAPNGVADQGSSLLNASQFQNAAGATLKGLAATNCQLPSNDLWLVGGSTSTGREALLILRNTTQVDSTVSLQIFSEAGSVEAPGLNGIAVVAGKTTVVTAELVVRQDAGSCDLTGAAGKKVTLSVEAETSSLKLKQVSSASGADWASLVFNYSPEYSDEPAVNIAKMAVVVTAKKLTCVNVKTKKTKVVTTGKCPKGFKAKK